MRSTLCRVLLVVALGGLVLTGCSDDESSDTDPDRSTTTRPTDTTGGSDLEGSITVSGASSLRDALTEIADGFEAMHPGVEVTVNFDSSSTLASQIIEGVPVDVFASADEANMEKVAAAGQLDGDPRVFARNELVIVTKPDNPAGISSLADLADAGVVSLCGEDVPCGKYAKQALDLAGVTIPESSVTRGQNVQATLTAVAEGDAVAGIVYVTDALAAADAVEAIDIPAAQNVTASYPVGVISTASALELASAFVELVLSDQGLGVLEEYGFLPPG